MMMRGKKSKRRRKRAPCKKNALENRWLSVTNYKQGIYNQVAFKEYTDSNILHHITNGIKEISDTTLLFSFEKKKIYAADWAVYITAKIAKILPDYSENLKEFVNTSCAQYYADNLELYSKVMQDQCKEFDEANVLFAAMDRHVWGKSGANPDELRAFYEKNKAKYQWKESVSGILVNAKSKEAATEIASRIKAAPQDWRKVADSYGANVTVDSSRYEVAQLPLKQHIDTKEGFETTPEKNTNDDGYSFIYVVKAHPQKEQRIFEDAKGAATNDYQQQLEEEWLASLKKKYPVKVNDVIWKTIQ
jgi:peptidyl-prolyl cis-trans isomerase SurA